jgi:glycosyltransferase involved in cell wall biosynthesis
MANTPSSPRLSVVVIGLNEEARLRSALQAVFDTCPVHCELEVFYVDSGSKDSSVAIAEAMPGVQVLRLQAQRPSAAKARNLGLAQVRGDYVQLIDGDSVLQAGWLEAAMRTLEANSGVACVFGQCVEAFPEQSIYMRVCGLDWHIPAGDHRLCGGNAMWRREVIAAHGFFDEALQLGEEPDLCYRVRQQGHRIVCVDQPMVLHDLAMVTFKQYWRRGEATGKAYARVASRYWRLPEKMWLREVLRNFMEPLVWAMVMAAGWVTVGGVGGGLLALLAWWLLRATKIAWTVRTRAEGWLGACLYGLHCQFIRLPVVVGQVQGLRQR